MSLRLRGMLRRYSIAYSNAPGVTCLATAGVVCTVLGLLLLAVTTDQPTSGAAGAGLVLLAVGVITLSALTSDL